MLVLLAGCSRDGPLPPVEYHRPYSSPQSVNVSDVRQGYLVQKGDTVYALSRRFDVPVRDIIATNNLRAPFALRVGQELNIPPPQHHIVKTGETIFGIARQYGVDRSRLVSLNNVRTPYTIYPGQRLVIPGASVTTASSDAPVAPTTTPSKKSSSASKAKPPKSTQAAPGSGKFTWPVRGQILSSFGPKQNGLVNDGINIAASEGASFTAADHGTVIYADDGIKGFGNLILIKHGTQWVTAYAHAKEILVKKGDKVKKGQKIGLIGKTGNVDRPQLHFEMRKNNKPQNPLSYLPK